MPIKQIHINLLLKSVFFSRKLSLVIFISCFFNVVSAQLFIKNNTTFSIIEDASVYSSDSVVTKQSIITEKPKIYIIKGTSTHQLEKTDADIIYVPADKSQQKTKVAKTSHKHSKKKTQKKPEVEPVTKQNFRFIVSRSSANKNLSENGFNDVVMILSNKPLSKFAIISDIQTYLTSSYLPSSCSLVNSRKKIDISHNYSSVTRPPPVLL